jgi:hypothetical protein
VDRFSRDEWPHAARRVCAVAAGTRATGAALAYTGKDSGNVTGDAMEAQVEVEYFPLGVFRLLVALQRQRRELDFERTRFDGNLNLDNRGPQRWARSASESQRCRESTDSGM